MKKPNVDSEKLHEWFVRGVLILIAVLFLGTALFGGIYYLWADKEQAKQDQEQSNKLAGKPLPDFTPVQDIKKLQVIDKKDGDGKVVKTGSNLTVIYTGALASTGIVFESSTDNGQPASFDLNGVIKGWQEGLIGMKEGGTRRLLIPADLAYGANPPQGSTIPPNADLVFDVILIAVK